MVNIWYTSLAISCFYKQQYQYPCTFEIYLSKINMVRPGTFWFSSLQTKYRLLHGVPISILVIDTLHRPPSSRSNNRKRLALTRHAHPSANDRSSIDLREGAVFDVICKGCISLEALDTFGHCQTPVFLPWCIPSLEEITKPVRIWAQLVIEVARK